jgi:AraC family transcriptional regulator
MDALIRTLYTSDQFEITDFACRCTQCGYSGFEFQNKFSICYIRRGSFLFKVFSEELECFNSRFLLNRPGFTHRVKHYHLHPDECIIIGFSPEFYEKMKDVYFPAFNGFLVDANIHSMVVQSSSETEYLMYRLRYALAASETDRLCIDGIVLELAEKIFHMQEVEYRKTISEKQKLSFLPAIEKSMEWVQENFAEPITMDDLARVSYMSVFHFNRAFKEIVKMSPYQYLLNFRIQHASHLLVSTDEAISHIGWSAGFNRPDHFSYAFKGVTGLSPQQYRNKKKQEF